MTARDRARLEELLSDATRLQAALREQVRKALQAHSKAGRSVVVWRDGRVVEVSPEDALSAGAE